VTPLEIDTATELVLALIDFRKQAGAEHAFGNLVVFLQGLVII
jgi:hypothetical protein